MIIAALSITLAFFIFTTGSLIVIEYRLYCIQQNNRALCDALAKLLPTAKIIQLRGRA